MASSRDHHILDFNDEDDEDLDLVKKRKFSRLSKLSSGSSNSGGGGTNIYCCSPRETGQSPKTKWVQQCTNCTLTLSSDTIK